MSGIWVEAGQEDTPLPQTVGEQVGEQAAGLSAISRPLKILVADDTNSDRLLLTSILQREGHSVVQASNGIEAISSYERERPDLVLLDALMPELDGLGAARRIKQLAGDELVPIIFLTSLSDTESLVQCLEAGGDDFLSKPYNRIILQAKIQAFNRMREMHSTMLAQRNEIAKYNSRLLQEQRVARHVFDNVAHSGCLNAPNIRYFLSSLAVFNGDVLLAAMRPNGNMMLLLGDFTGHGLPAAIGAMPLAATFYGMVPKGYAMPDILREINSKLKKVLPVGLFCCATMLDINFRQQSIKVWNGGLPEGFIYHRENARLTSLTSRHLPLGVLSDNSFNNEFECFSLAPGDRIFLWSDGIHEARNPQGIMFGEERLRAVFACEPVPNKLFDSIMAQVHEFVGSHSQDDDISLIEIEMVPPGAVGLAFAEASERSTGAAVAWSMDFEVAPSSFQVYDPIPLLLNVLMEVPSLCSFSSTIYTILAELYTNALEHGVLGLDSALKQSAEGFNRYYQLRDERIRQLHEGYVRFHIFHRTHEQGGKLCVRVEDSGAGFDYQGRAHNNELTDYSGRGIALLEKLCTSVRYLGSGNIVEVEFSWSHAD